MLTDIAEIAMTDGRAVSLLSKARECAEIYLLVTKRQRGCDGMGELAMIREEFREAVDGLISYYKEKEYLAGDFQYDLDAVAYALIGTQ